MQEIENLKNSLEIVLNRIAKLEGFKSYTDRLAEAFPLGMVGGSGRNVARLNRKRASELDATIKRAGILCELYKKRDAIKGRIEFIESGGPEKKANAEERKIQLLLKYWEQLKIGDSVEVGSSSPLIITKKSKKSLIAGSCSWSASEIIGRKAASLIQ